MRDVFEKTAKFLIENGYEPSEYKDIRKALGSRPNIQVQWGCFENPRTWEVSINLVYSLGKSGVYYKDLVVFKIGREASNLKRR